MINTKNDILSVAVVIPCRNEEKYIEKCITSVLSQSYSASEIFVCDGKSNDGTKELLKKIAANNKSVIVLDNEKLTTPFALNLGIKNSKSDIVIILGAHSEMKADFIFHCVKSFSIDEKIGCAGGIIENIYDTKTSEAIGRAMSSPFGVGNAHFRTGGKDGYVDTVAFGAYKKEVFEKIGYFDEMLIRNQDDEFNFRLIKAGYKIYLNKEIKSDYYVRASFGKLFRQYYQYGYWKVIVNRKHKMITTGRQLVPAFFVLYLLTGIIASIFVKVIMAGWLSGLAFYLLLSFIFALRAGKNTGELFSVMLSFFILHLSYGAGYLRSAIDIFLLQKKIKTNESITR